MKPKFYYVLHIGFVNIQAKFRLIWINFKGLNLFSYMN